MYPSCPERRASFGRCGRRLQPGASGYPRRVHLFGSVKGFINGQRVGNSNVRLTIIDEIHQTGRCTDTDTSLVVLEKLNLLFNFHVLGELEYVSIRSTNLKRRQTYQFRDRIFFVLEFAHRSAIGQFPSSAIVRRDIPNNICSSQARSCNNDGMRRSFLLG